MPDFFLFLPYNILLHAFLPFYCALAWRRHRRRGGAAREVFRRLALPGLTRGGRTGRLPRGAIWIHAVSVGEAAAARPLVAKLLARNAGPIFLTATTETGYRALKRFFPELPAVFFPFDLPLTWHVFLRRTSPRALVCLETELWPNLMRALYRRRIPFVLVNGRLSDRSWRRYRRLRFLFRPLLARQGWYGMRGEREAARLEELGAPGSRVTVTGNLKYDQALAEVSAPVPALPVRFSGPSLVFASLHADEEAAAVMVVQRLRETRRDFNPVFVPRHPERGRLASLLAGKGIPWKRLPEKGTLKLAPGEALLVERFGLLGAFYRSAAAVFVGGSLVPAGGQNMLEPAAWGCPVAFGPWTCDFREEAGFLVEKGAATRVSGPDELQFFFERLLSGDSALSGMGGQGRAAVRAGAGAADRSLKLVEKALAAALPGRDSRD